MNSPFTPNTSSAGCWTHLWPVGGVSAAQRSPTVPSLQTGATRCSVFRPLWRWLGAVRENVSVGAEDTGLYVTGQLNCKTLSESLDVVEPSVGPRRCPGPPERTAASPPSTPLSWRKTPQATLVMGLRLWCQAGLKLGTSSGEQA